MRLSFETPLIGPRAETLDREIPGEKQTETHRRETPFYVFGFYIKPTSAVDARDGANVQRERRGARAHTPREPRRGANTRVRPTPPPHPRLHLKPKDLYHLPMQNSPRSRSQVPCSPLSLKRRERPRTSSHRPIPPNSSQQPRTHAFAILRFSFSNAASILAYLLLSSESKYGCSSASVAWMRLAGSYTSIF